MHFRERVGSAGAGPGPRVSDQNDGDNHSVLLLPRRDAMSSLTCLLPYIMILCPAGCLAFLLAAGQFSQTNTGELRLTVTDTTGFPLPGPVEVSERSDPVRPGASTPSDTGLRVSAGDFLRSIPDAVSPRRVRSLSTLVEIRSALPTGLSTSCSLSPVVQAQLTRQCGRYSALDRSPHRRPRPPHRRRHAPAAHDGVARAARSRTL